MFLALSAGADAAGTCTRVTQHFCTVLQPPAPRLSNTRDCGRLVFRAPGMWAALQPPLADRHHHYTAMKSRHYYQPSTVYMVTPCASHEERPDIASSKTLYSRNHYRHDVRTSPRSARIQLGAQAPTACFTNTLVVFDTRYRLTRRIQIPGCVSATASTSMTE